MKNLYEEHLNESLSNPIHSAETKLGKMSLEFGIPDFERAENVGLFLPPRSLKRILYFSEIYEKVLGVHGSIVQFGVRWGRDLTVLDSLRNILEPFNPVRRIIGFDTFTGLKSVSAYDSAQEQPELMSEGSLSTSENHVEFLSRLLEVRKVLAPLQGPTRTSLVVGDASETLKDYLKANTETIIAMAHFDMDIYKPTKDCLELILPRMPKGAIIAFDELNYSIAPGETVALDEVLGIRNIRIQRSARFSGAGSYIILD